ncbi:hypothetical protein DYBT9623_04419 [Dyadobacter sp. CECT 9623]|uniref:Uncharacterized protein n=1 Tax=Dyadobacter linearis TaxID=2823330 RepID=A0ABN7RCE4_9BACT|nr:hypothetical protein [Dyadobacter sp. CECT 9623]CAG5072879.1 hypothetical protein DYBT9623_04419 [Dyadobacter sp. CECT 9623]
MGLIVSFGDYGVGDIVQDAQDLYDLLLDLCQDQLEWKNILNKPELYLKTELYNRQEIDQKLEDIAPGAHTHTIADVDGLQDALDDRYTQEQVNNFLSGKSDIGHIHPTTDIEGLQEAIAALGVQIVNILPMPVQNGKVYMVHIEGSASFSTFITVNGQYIPLDAVTYAALATALSAKQNKLTGSASQYVRGDGSYGEMNKGAVGLGNVANLSAANLPISDAQAAVNAQKADDSTVLHKTGNETKSSGVLTFALSPVVPMPTASNHAASKAYVDSMSHTSDMEFIFDNPSEEWIITHNLNRKPDTNIVIGGYKVISDVQYIDNDVLKIIHTKPEIGLVILTV